VFIRSFVATAGGGLDILTDMEGAWFGILGCSLLGLWFGIPGLVRVVVLLRLRSKGVSATGRVVRLERFPYEPSEYTPMALFKANGQRYEARGARRCLRASCRRRFRHRYGVGDWVQVYYPPGHPERGQIVTRLEWTVAWRLLAVGIVFIVLGFFALATALLDRRI